MKLIPKEITVGSGKQISYGQYKSHASVTLTVPEGATWADVEKECLSYQEECRAMVVEDLQNQVFDHQQRKAEKAAEEAKKDEIPY